MAEEGWQGGRVEEDREGGRDREEGGGRGDWKM